MKRYLLNQLKLLLELVINKLEEPPKYNKCFFKVEVESACKSPIPKKEAESIFNNLLNEIEERKHQPYQDFYLTDKGWVIRKYQNQFTKEYTEEPWVPQIFFKPAERYYDLGNI